MCIYWPTGLSVDYTLNLYMAIFEALSFDIPIGEPRQDADFLPRQDIQWEDQLLGSIFPHCKFQIQGFFWRYSQYSWIEKHWSLTNNLTVRYVYAMAISFNKTSVNTVTSVTMVMNSKTTFSDRFKVNIHPCACWSLICELCIYNIDNVVIHWPSTHLDQRLEAGCSETLFK